MVLQFDIVTFVPFVILRFFRLSPALFFPNCACYRGNQIPLLDNCVSFVQYMMKSHLYFIIHLGNEPRYEKTGFLPM